MFLWNFLFFTGYLKKIKEVYEEGNIYSWLAIPNEERRYIYRNSVLKQTVIFSIWKIMLEKVISAILWSRSDSSGKHIY